MSYGSNGINNNSTTNDSPSGGGGSSYSGNSYGTSKVIDYDKWGLGLSNVQTNTVENTSNRYVGGFSNVPVGNSNSDSLGFSRGGFSTTVVTDTSNHNIYTSNITSDGLYYDISGNGYWDGNTAQFNYYDTSFNKMTHISIGNGLGGNAITNSYNYNIWGRMITNFTGKVYFRIICNDLGAIYISDTSFNAPSNGSTGDPDLNLHEGIECPTWSPANNNAGNTGTYDVVANKQYFIRILWGEGTGNDYLYMWAESDSNRVYFPNQGDISSTLANYPVTNLTNGNVLFFSGEPLMSYYAPPGNYFPGETIPICARWYDKVSITTDPSLILHGISHTYKLEAGAGALDGSNIGQGVATASDTDTWSSDYQPTAAFDNTIVDADDVWHSTNSSFPHWLSFEFPNEKYITKYKIWTRTNAINLHAPKDWQLLGIRESQIGSISDFSYNVLSTYTIIDTQSNQTNWSQSITSDITNDINRKEYYVANPGYYKYYVLYITDGQTGYNYVSIAQVAYYANDYPYGGANIYKLHANDTWSIDASNLIGDLSNNNPNMGLYPYGQLGYNGDVAIDSSYALISTKRGEERLAAGAGALNGTGGAQGVASVHNFHDGPAVGIPTWTIDGAFDGTIDYLSHSGNTSDDREIRFEFPTSKYITRYKIWCNTNSYNPKAWTFSCLLYTSPSPRDRTRSRMPSSA